MGFNDYEISPEQENEILQEVFPELLEFSESSEEGERGRHFGGGGSKHYAVGGARRFGGSIGRQVGGYRRGFSSRILSRNVSQRPSTSGYTGQKKHHHHKRWPGRGSGYGYGDFSSNYGDNSGVGKGQQSPDLMWAQGCLSQILGPWVQQTGWYDSVTRRAIRIFQSRSRLYVTGWLDGNTRAALSQVCGQGGDAAPAPTATGPADTLPPDSAADAAQDVPPDQDSPTGAPPSEIAPQQEHFRRRHMLRNHWNQFAGTIAPPFSQAFEQEAWETEAPPQSGKGTELTCKPPIVLDGFRTGDYTIRRQHYAKLIALVGALPAPVIVIRGHTDNQGDAISNAGLSLSRAFEAWQWLTLALGGKQIGGQIVIDALGATAPVTSNATDAGRSRNRRVEILLCQAPPPPPIIAGTRRVTLKGSSVAEFGPGEFSGEVSLEAPSGKDWYYIDSWRTDTGTPQKIKSYGPWQDTAANAARIYDGMCGQFQSSDQSKTLVRCYIWGPASGTWIPCKNSVGFPGTAFCGRLDRS